MPDDSAHLMTCMQVWGGNALARESVSIFGLDAWVYCKPHANSPAGGDVYYLSSCATGRITRLLLADVSGHGSGVEKAAGELRKLMQRYVNHLDQRSFVEALNRKFAEYSGHQLFATAVVATFFGPTGELALCNAGHPAPLHWSDRDKHWSLLEPAESPAEDVADLPLGIEDATHYGERALDLGPADIVLCYSDALMEAHDQHGKQLGQEGLLRVMQGIPAGEPAAMVDRLLEALRALHPENLNEDDVTILLFRPSTVRKRPGFFGRAFAPLRVTGAAIRSLFPGGSPPPLPDFSMKNLLGSLIPWMNRKRKPRTGV